MKLAHSLLQNKNIQQFMKGIILTCKR